MEFLHIGEDHTHGSKSKMELFMISKGYKVRAKVTNKGNKANDLIFAKEGLNEDVILEDIHT